MTEAHHVKVGARVFSGQHDEHAQHNTTLQVGFLVAMTDPVKKRHLSRGTHNKLRRIDIALQQLNTCTTSSKLPSTMQKPVIHVIPNS
jgi:hypothetical protein